MLWRDLVAEIGHDGGHDGAADGAIASAAGYGAIHCAPVLDRAADLQRRSRPYSPPAPRARTRPPARRPAALWRERSGGLRGPATDHDAKRDRAAHDRFVLRRR